MKRTKLRAGDRLNLGDGRSVLIEEIGPTKVTVLAESPELIYVESRTADGEDADGTQEPDPARSA